MTTGGVPDGMLSPPPKTLDNMKSNVANPTTPAIRTCTLLLRSVGYRDDRVAYGGGFEVFRVGSARCMVASILRMKKYYDVQRADVVNATRCEGLTVCWVRIWLVHMQIVVLSYVSHSHNLGILFLSGPTLQSSRENTHGSTQNLLLLLLLGFVDSKMRLVLSGENVLDRVAPG
jgi:hypothetical protein